MPFVYPQIAIGEVNYPVFAELADAMDYLAVDPLAAGWLAGDEIARNKWLVMATRILDRQNWRGEKTDEENALAWPRTGIEDVDPATIPDRLEFATIELASQLANGYDAAGQITTASSIKSQRAGSVAQEFFAPGLAGTDPGHRFPLPVWELIKSWIEAAGGESFGASSASGTCGPRISEIDYTTSPFVGPGGGCGLVRRDYD
jgi:hypothetical protein